VFFANGLILARDASLQARHGREIQINNTQLGDLLFFGRKATETETERITHVALSTGDSEFIHASGHIRQNSFNPDSPIYSEYRKNSFVKAMRIIGFEGDGIQHIKNHSWY
jgi:cell wall-associated NlpC family hydrolase